MELLADGFSASRPLLCALEGNGTIFRDLLFLHQVCHNY